MDDEMLPAAAPVDPAPPPAPMATPPSPVREPLTWEDRVAIGSALLILVGCVVPWYDGQTWFRPTFEAWIAAGLAAGALIVMGLLRGPQNETTRRQAGAVLGLGTLALAAYVIWVYYRFHAATNARLGAVGHLLYLGPGLDAAFVGAVLLVWGSIRTLRPDPVVGAPVAPVEAHLPAWKQWAVPLAIFLLAFTVYNDHVEKPSIIDFDEAHYVRVALNLTDGVIIDPAWGEPRPFNFEHPPVGKYFIAMGYKLMGEPHDELGWTQYNELCKTDNPACERDAYGWRFGSVLVGSLGVLGMYWLGLRLFRNMAAGLSAAALLLSDNLYYLHARTAMLDIFAVAFVLLGFGVFLGPTRRHKYLGSAFFGLGLASKHYALFVLPVFALLAFLTSRHTDRFMRFRDFVLFGLLVPFLTYVAAYVPYLFVWLRMAFTTGLAPRHQLVDAFGWLCILAGAALSLGSRRLQVLVAGAILGIGLGLTVQEDTMTGFLPLLAVPAALALGWALRRRMGTPTRLAQTATVFLLPLVAFWLALSPTVGLAIPRRVVEHLLVPIDQFLFTHQEGFRWTYRAELDKPHPYVSQAWTWIPMRRPVFYFVGYDAAQNVGHIYAIGNPFTWWTGSFAVLFALFGSVISWGLRMPRLGLRAFWSWFGRAFSLHRDNAMLLAALLFVFAYFPFFLLKRDPFNFYFLIAAPFFALVLAGFMGSLWQRGYGHRLLVVAFVAAAVAVFVFYHPVVAGTYIPESDFQFIMRALQCPTTTPGSVVPRLEVCMRQ